MTCFSESFDEKSVYLLCTSLNSTMLFKKSPSMMKLILHVSKEKRKERAFSTTLGTDLGLLEMCSKLTAVLYLRAWNSSNQKSILLLRLPANLTQSPVR